MLNRLLTRWELSPEDKFFKFFQELQDYLKKQLNYSHLQNGKDYWSLDFDYMEWYNGCLPAADPFKHTKRFCEQHRFNWQEVREMINEHFGQLVLDDAEIVNGYKF